MGLLDKVESNETKATKKAPVKAVAQMPTQKRNVFSYLEPTSNNNITNLNFRIKCFS